MHRIPPLLAPLLALLLPVLLQEPAPPVAPAAVPEAPPADAVVQRFDRAGEGTPFTLLRAGMEPGPEVKDGALLLVNGGRARGAVSNSVAFPLVAKGCHRRVRASFKFTMGKGAHGGGFALLDTVKYGTEGDAPRLDAWEEPNLRGSFAVGLDTFDPPTSQWFDGNGNVHDRPEREVSLHWDGAEIANTLSPVEFRDGEPHRFDLDLRFVNGGALATLRIDDAFLHRDRFLPGVVPYESRAAIGGRTGDTATNLEVDDVEVRWEDPAAREEITRAPIRVRAFDREVLHAGRGTARAAADLPPADREIERVVLRLTLEPPAGDWDEWDRCAAVHLYRKDGEREETVEILRYITPFRRTYTWSADVSEYRSLLSGRAELGVHAGSIYPKTEDPSRQRGYAVTLDLDFYPGKPARAPLGVANLWQTWFTFGNTPEEIAAAFKDLEVVVPAAAKSAILRLRVTGHGGFGEFNAADLVATFAGTEFPHRLWKTDVYLNPCRPQSGTWKFDRAGWGPGSVVEPADFDITALLKPGEKQAAGYRALPFKDPPKGFEASHWVDAQVIFFR